MATPKIETLVDRAIAIDRQRRELDEELEGIEAVLKEHAEANRKEEGDKTDGGGWTVDITGASGQVVTVVQAGPSVKSLKDDSKDLLAVRQVLGAGFKELYVPELTYKPIEGYRDAIKVTLDGATRRALLKLATKNGSLRVNYKTKKTAIKGD